MLNYLINRMIAFRMPSLYRTHGPQTSPKGHRIYGLYRWLRKKSGSDKQESHYQKRKLLRAWEVPKKVDEKIEHFQLVGKAHVFEKVKFIKELERLLEMAERAS